MPVTSTTVDARANLVTYVVEGDITLDDLREAIDRATEDAGFRPAMNSLWNLKAGHVAITVNELPAMISYLSRIDDRRGRDYRVAILVRSNEDFGLSSLFEMNSYTLPFEVQVFRNSSEALEWVSKPSTAKRS